MSAFTDKLTAARDAGITLGGNYTSINMPLYENIGLGVELAAALTGNNHNEAKEFEGWCAERQIAVHKDASASLKVAKAIFFATDDDKKLPRQRLSMYGKAIAVCIKSHKYTRPEVVEWLKASGGIAEIVKPFGDPSKNSGTEGPKKTDYLAGINSLRAGKELLPINLSAWNTPVVVILRPHGDKAVYLSVSNNEAILRAAYQDFTRKTELGKQVIKALNDKKDELYKKYLKEAEAEARKKADAEFKVVA